MSKSVLAALIVALGAILAALAVASAVEAATTGHVSVIKISLLGTALACLVVFVGLFVTAPGTRPVARTPHCHNCGARLFATLRSLDRRELLTCFSCGSEWVLPPSTPALYARPMGPA